MQGNYIEGLDISHYQEHINWTELTPNKSGKQFIIAKASEGTSFKDPSFVKNWENVCLMGFKPGAYHFLRFSNAQAQMDNFIGQLNAADSSGRWRNGIIALDVEATPNDGESVKKVVEECVEYLIKTHNVTPYIYTMTSYWEKYVDVTPDVVKQCPLWIARWRGREPLSNELPTGWEKWKIWQYSSQGSVVGITTPVDLNRMKVADTP